ncbi:MAG: hypothetical protein AB7P20_28920, partial [Rhizobiaceae bacterium]
MPANVPAWLTRYLSARRMAAMVSDSPGKFFAFDVQRLIELDPVASCYPVPRQGGRSMWDFSIGRSLSLLLQTWPFVLFRVFVYTLITIGYLFAIGAGG